MTAINRFETTLSTNAQRFSLMHVLLADSTMAGITFQARKNRMSEQEIALSAQELACRTWLVAIAKHEEQALGALYDATLGKVFAVALRITGKPESAEEVVTDVYMQVWRDAAKYDATRGKALTWLLTICRSRALDLLRRSDPALLHEDPESLSVDLPHADDPQDLLLTLERQSKVHAALETLNPIQRQMVALAFFKGLSHQEIADHSGLPLGTVKTHLRKALEALHDTLTLTQTSGIFV